MFIYINIKSYLLSYCKFYINKQLISTIMNNLFTLLCKIGIDCRAFPQTLLGSVIWCYNKQLSMRFMHEKAL